MPRLNLDDREVMMEYQVNVRRGNRVIAVLE